MAAGSVLWILAMVDGAQQAKAAGEGFSLSAILTACHVSLVQYIGGVKYLHDMLPFCKSVTYLVTPDCKTSGKAD